MTKYRKKPEIADAYEVGSHNLALFVLEAIHAGKIEIKHDDQTDRINGFWVETENGVKSADKSDFIVRNQNGTLTVHSKETFFQSYELINFRQST